MTKVIDQRLKQNLMKAIGMEKAVRIAKDPAGTTTTIIIIKVITQTPKLLLRLLTFGNMVVLIVVDVRAHLKQ